MCKFHSLYSLCMQNTSHFFLTLFRKEYPDRIPCVAEISHASQDLPSLDQYIVLGDITPGSFIHKKPSTTRRPAPRR